MAAQGSQREPWQRTVFVGLTAAAAFWGSAASTAIDNLLIELVIAAVAGLIAGGVSRYTRIAGWWLAGIIGAGVLLILIIVIVGALSEDTRRQPVITGHEDVRVSQGPNAIVADSNDGVWVVTNDGGLYSIDEDRGARKRVSLRKSLFDVDVGHGFVWATAAGRLYRVNRTNPKRVLASEKYGTGNCEVAVAPNGVWFKDFMAGKLYLIGRKLGKPIIELEIAGPNAIAVGLGSLWVTTGAPEDAHGTVRRYSLSGKLQRTYRVPPDPQDLLVGDKQVWINHYGPHRLTRLSPGGKAETTDLGTTAPSGIARGLGAVWVPSEHKGDVSAILESEFKAVDQAAVGNRPTDVAVAGDRVYVPSEPDDYVRVFTTEIKDVEK
jgi:hypothetical protein